MLAVIKPLQPNWPPEAGVKSWPLEISRALAREEYFSNMKTEMETIIFCDYPRVWSKRKTESLWIADNFLWWLIPRKFWYYSCSVTKWWFQRCSFKELHILCHNGFSGATYPLKGPGLQGSTLPLKTMEGLIALGVMSYVLLAVFLERSFIK